MIKIELQGFKELADELKQYGPRVAKRGLRSSNYAGAMVIVEAAKATSAFHNVSGMLRKAIWAYKRKTPETIATHAVAVKGISRTKSAKAARKAFKEAGFKLVAGPYIYGWFVEYGTSKMKARPFLRPAFEANVGKTIQTIKVGLEDALLKAVGRGGGNARIEAQNFNPVAEPERGIGGGA